MPKILKIIGTIITVAALVVGVAITGGGLAIGLPATFAANVGFTAGLVGGISAFGFAAIGAAISTIGASLANAPGLDETGAGDRHIPVLDVDAPGYYVFGETAVPLTLTFEETFNNDEQVTAVFAHAWHLIDSFVSMHVDGELYTHSGGVGSGAFAGILNWRQNLGTAAQSALTLAGTSYASTAKGSGIAHSGLEWNLGNGQTKYNSVPQKISIRVIGSEMYDPRKDTSVGGSGSHDYDDPDSWEIPAVNPGNASLVALRYGIGEFSAAGELIWGVGEPKGKVDFASFIAMANVADEIRDSVRRYELGGMFPTNNNHQAFFRTWQANTGGKIARQQGKRFIWLPHDDLTSLHTITDADLVAEIPFEMEMGPDPRQLVNAGRGKYISRGDLFQPVGYPGVVEAAYETADGRRRTLPVDYSWIHDVSTAERLTRMAIRRSRFGRIFSFGVGWQGLLWPPFSILTINTVETDNSDVLVRVINRRIVSNGVCVLVCQEEHADIYDEADALGTSPPVTAAPPSVDPLAVATPAILTAAGNRQFSVMENWNFNNSEEGFTATGATLTKSTFEIEVDSTGINPLFKSAAGQAIDGATARFVRARIKRTAGSVGSWTGDLLYSTSGHGLSSSHRKTIAVDPTITGTYVTVEFDMHALDAGGTDWATNVVEQLQFEFGAAATDTFDINWILVGEKAAGAGGTPLVNMGGRRGYNALDSNTQLNSNVQKLLGSTNRNIPAGVARDLFFDGDSISFTNTWQLTPDLTFAGGALTWKKIRDADQQVVFQALNPTVSGATASIRIKGLAGAANVITETTETAPGGTPSKVIEKTVTAEAGNDVYTFRHTSNGDDCEVPVGEPRNGYTDVGFYKRVTTGGPWTQLNEIRFNSTGTFDTGFNIDGLGQDAAFGIHEEDTGPCGSNGLTDFVHVKYDTASIASDDSATPAGADALALNLVGEQDQV